MVGMFCHVCSEDEVDQPPAHVVLKVHGRGVGILGAGECLWQHPEPVQMRVLLHCLERVGHMHIFQNALVVVHDSDGTHGLGVEEVAPSIVAYVVDGAGYHDHEVVDSVNLLCNARRLQEPLHRHHAVGCMKHVVVRVVGPVHILNLGNEAVEFLLEVMSLSSNLALLLELGNQTQARVLVRKKDLQQVIVQARQSGKCQNVEVQLPRALQERAGLAILQRCEDLNAHRLRRRSPLLLPWLAVTRASVALRFLYLGLFPVFRQVREGLKEPLPRPLLSARSLTRGSAPTILTKQLLQRIWGV
mmetsp:Transcript_103636/g.186998  ORF Transcript_103636/g.186998 Transcript_103636/m.186998 type:complete len:302 (+) Transcript_103636:523-1428(+)